MLFIDILGFSNLTEDFPEPFAAAANPRDGTSLAVSSGSSRTLERFQFVFEMLARQYVRPDALPLHQVLFSDCGFLVFDTLAHAATCSRELMFRFIQQNVPVRMGLAHGTWYTQRFSFELVGASLTAKSMFSGSGVVRAHKGEQHGGKGFRVFVHSSIDPGALSEISDDVPSLPTPEANPIAPNEINYLLASSNKERGGEVADGRYIMELGFAAMWKNLKQPLDPRIEIQYTSTMDAINRMRAQLGRPRFPAPWESP